MESSRSKEERSRETHKINASLIIEVIGKPPEHLLETLQSIINKIDEEKGVSVLQKKINSPIPMKDRPEFFTSFAEIEIEVEEILQLAFVSMKYMPAHLEIIYPELIALTNNGWNELFIEFLSQLHGYDEITRIAQVEKKILEDQLKRLSGKIPKDQKPKLDELHKSERV